MINFTPKENISNEERDQGMRFTIRDGITTQIMVTATEGIFLISFALLLGANNLFIGIIAALPFLSQITQILGIFILERMKKRRKIVVITVFLSRIFLAMIALLPLIDTSNIRLLLLSIFILVRNVFGAVAGVSWNSWMRDLIPSNQLGSFFAKRMTTASKVGTVLLIVFSLFLDFWDQQFGQWAIYGYSILFIIGFISGMIGVFFLYKTPEPKLPSIPAQSLKKLFQKPYSDKEFRPLIIFLFFWNFAINLAAPFFTVYMITQLELPIFFITLFLVLSQFFNIRFLSIWGSFADRFSYKSILLVCTPLFIGTFPLWTFTTLPGVHFLTYPILIVIHIILGITMAGINLSIGTIAMKLSPQEASSAYLATAGIVNAVAAGSGTIIGGILGDFFVDKSLMISLEWVSSTSSFAIPTISLKYWDFVFMISFILGLLAIERLTAVKEQGSISRKEAVSEFFNSVRSETRRSSTIAGLNRLVNIIPFSSSRNHKGRQKLKGKQIED